MPDEVVWAEELPEPSRSPEWTAEAYELAMTKPGMWARVRAYSNAASCHRIVGQIRKPGAGRLSTPPPGKWDAAARKDAGKTWLWIKYEPLETVDIRTVMHRCSTARSLGDAGLSTRSAQANHGSIST